MNHVRKLCLWHHISSKSWKTCFVNDFHHFWSPQVVLVMYMCRQSCFKHEKHEFVTSHVHFNVKTSKKHHVSMCPDRKLWHSDPYTLSNLTPHRFWQWFCTCLKGLKKSWNSLCCRMSPHWVLSHTFLLRANSRPEFGGIRVMSTRIRSEFGYWLKKH